MEGRSLWRCSPEVAAAPAATSLRPSGKSIPALVPHSTRGRLVWGRDVTYRRAQPEIQFAATTSGIASEWDRGWLHSASGFPAPGSTLGLGGSQMLAKQTATRHISAYTPVAVESRSRLDAGADKP
jgi:hypothetical protein